jgi:hypothetical protein
VHSLAALENSTLICGVPERGGRRAGAAYDLIGAGGPHASSRAMDRTKARHGSSFSRPPMGDRQCHGHRMRPKGTRTRQLRWNSKSFGRRLPTNAWTTPATKHGLSGKRTLWSRDRRNEASHFGRRVCSLCTAEKVLWSSTVGTRDGVGLHGDRASRAAAPQAAGTNPNGWGNVTNGSFSRCHPSRSRSARPVPVGRLHVREAQVAAAGP